jgi:flagellar biosynthesis chaperone FliJ
LDQILGYDVHLHNRIIRERKSTTDFRDVQAWNVFLKTIEETIFDAAGYEFPDSKNFWELVDKYGYEQAERISVETLQRKLILKNTSNA